MDEKIDYYESNYEPPDENFETIEQKHSRLLFQITTLRSKLKNLSKDISSLLADSKDLYDEIMDSNETEKEYDYFFKQYMKLNYEINQILGENYE